MNLSKAEAATLGRRREQPVKQADELLAIWVPGKLKNPLNGPQYGKQKFVQSRYRRDWKDRVALALFEIRWRAEGKWFVPTGALDNYPTGPTRVLLTASVHQKFDSDGLQAACKPIRDALVECGVVSGDAERDGHVWEYAQRIDRARRGIEIRVRLSPGTGAGQTGVGGSKP